MEIFYVSSGKSYLYRKHEGQQLQGGKKVNAMMLPYARLVRKYAQSYFVSVKILLKENTVSLSKKFYSIKSLKMYGENKFAT